VFAERQLLNVSDKQTNQRASTRKLLCPLLTRSLFRHKRSMAVAVCGRGRKGASKKIHVLRSAPCALVGRGAFCVPTSLRCARRSHCPTLKRPRKGLAHRSAGAGIRRRMRHCHRFSNVAARSRVPAWLVVPPPPTTSWPLDRW